VFLHSSYLAMFIEERSQTKLSAGPSGSMISVQRFEWVIS
jgi:hypothetical protein